MPSAFQKRLNFTTPQNAQSQPLESRDNYGSLLMSKYLYHNIILWLFKTHIFSPVDFLLWKSRPKEVSYLTFLAQMGFHTSLMQLISHFLIHKVMSIFWLDFQRKKMSWLSFCSIYEYKRFRAQKSVLAIFQYNNTEHDERGTCKWRL